MADPEDYIRAILTDEEEPAEALERLRAVYPNLMRLEYDNRRTRAAGAFDAAAGVRASTISPLTTRSSRCTVRTQAFGSPSACRTSSGTPPGSSVERTPAGFTHTMILLSRYNTSTVTLLLNTIYCITYRVAEQGILWYTSPVNARRKPA